jgi:hypothetical protein
MGSRVRAAYKLSLEGRYVIAGDRSGSGQLRSFQPKRPVTGYNQRLDQWQVWRPKAQNL